MNLARPILFLFLLFIFSCGSSKGQVTPEEIERLNKLVEEQAFEIESDWALPFTTNSLVSVQNSGLFPPGSQAGQINLTTTSNFFRIVGDSIASDLPYYGEVQFSAGHYGGGDGGIELIGEIEDLKIEKIEKNHSYRFKFNASSENEKFRVILILFPNGRSSLRINGFNRFPIEYTGNYSSLANEVAINMTQ